LRLHHEREKDTEKGKNDFFHLIIPKFSAKILLFL
jgi:hypothetical protein